MPTYTFRFPASLPSLPVTVYPLTGGVRGASAATGTTGSDSTFTTTLAAGDYLAVVQYRGTETGVRESLAGGLADTAVTVDALNDPTSDASVVLKGALVPFWAAGETVTTGTVRMDSSGRTITRNSTGTARSTYDATEQALWTVTSSAGGGSLPAQTGNGGKFLTTNGTAASWSAAYALSSGTALMPAPSGDTTGATDTANLKAALASLPTVTIYPTPSTKAGTSATFHVGTIYLQAAPADVWWDQISANIVGTPYYLGTTGVSTGDVGNLGPFVSIIGPGHNACVIRYIGTGDALRMYNTVFPSSDTFDTLAAFAGKFDGFTIDGSLAGAGAVGLHYGDTEGGVLGNDLWIANFVGGSVGTPSTASKGLFFDNAVAWTENIYAKVNLYNNTIGVYYSPTTGDVSFMYSDVHFKIYGWPNQYGIMLDNGANFDNGSMVVRANLKTTASANTGALMAFGTSTSPNNRIADSHFDIQAETNSGISGGTNYPQTLKFTTAFYSITRCYGILSFGNTWTASNYNVSFALNYNGIIAGDATLLSAQAFNVAGVSVSGTGGTGKVLTGTSATAATWQTSAAGGAYYPWLVQGLLGWSFDDVATASTGSAPSASNITAAKVPIPSTITITNIIADVMTAGATLTSGSQNVAVVYDSAGNLLGQTADQATNWTTTGSKTMALVTPVAVTGGSGVFVWVGVLTAGTTVPQFARSAGTNNSGMVAPNLRFTRTSTGTITTPPATASLGSTSTTSFWFGIS